MIPAVNVPDFNLEEAYQSLLTANGVDLVGAPVLLGMGVADLVTTHVAVIVDSLSRSEDMPRSGNWKMDVHLKVVTAVDDETAAGYASLRAVHKQRSGTVRDVIMVAGLQQLLNAAADAVPQPLTVYDYDFSDIAHRIEGRSWVTEFVVHHNNVCSIKIRA